LLLLLLLSLLSLLPLLKEVQGLQIHSVILIHSLS
jgi:hypothetical protein